MAAAPPPPPVSHAHNPPPPGIRALHKRYQKLPLATLDADPEILDFSRLSEVHSPHIHIVSRLRRRKLQQIFEEFAHPDTLAQSIGDSDEDEDEGGSPNDRLIYEHDLLPGTRPSGRANIDNI